jgi:hypothetical protein
MSYDIKQSSTECALLFFLVLSSDHISPATGLSPTVTLSKNGAAFASPSGTVSEIANGWYKVAANATDTNTLGPLALHASVATADNCDMIVGNIVKYDPQLADLGLTVFQMTESYAVEGTAPTVAQALFAVQQMLMDFAWSGATLTVTKLDGSTAAMTFTANSSSNATALTRTT